MILNIRRIILAGFTLGFGLLFAQEMEQREERGFEPGMMQRERTGGEVVFFETHFILSTSDTHKVEALYRIRHDFFTFLRSTAGKDSYSAKAEAAIEILDSSGNSITRQIKWMEFEDGSNAIQDLRKKYSQGKMTFHLPPGKYMALFTIEDKESKRILPDVKRPLNIPFNKANNYSSLIPVDAELKTENYYHSYNLNGDVEFSKDFGFLFVSPKEKMTNAKYSIKRYIVDDDERITIVDTTVQCRVYSSSTLSTIEQNGEIYFQIEPSLQTAVYFVPVSGTSLKQGRYEIEITFDDSVKTKTRFASRWLTMPMSLTDLDLAIFPLQHILTKDDYSDINSGSRTSKIEKFEQFWKKKDRTPSTVYNEVMTEFYRRVDYTITAFRSLKEVNGSLTDRGKVYILYGKPTSTDRTLDPGASPKEVWKYSNLKKTFVFEDKSKQGNYRLAESK